MNSHSLYSPTADDPISIGPPPSPHSSLSLTQFKTWCGLRLVLAGELSSQLLVFKGLKVWCNLDSKAFGYEHPLVKGPTLAYPSDGSSIGEYLTSLIPKYSRDHLLTFDVIAYNGRRSVMRHIRIPTGGRQIASSPEYPVSDNSVHAHIAKSQALGRVEQQMAMDPEAATNLNYALSPGIPLKKVLQPCQQSSVPPSPIPPTPSVKEEYHHPTSPGGFLNVNCYDPMAYVGVPSQGSSPEFPGPFSFEEGLHQWTKTSKPLSDSRFQHEKATSQHQVCHAHKACCETMNKIANMMPNDLGAVDEWLKNLELSNYNETKGKGRAE
ncbi:hypothetical protein BY996DRAFT_6569859 [Phakopsora pachyrhizi]|nr:hypothetical protein BY996DRAFT_6569859 [Phakopsora pachyrhizi]